MPPPGTTARALVPALLVATGLVLRGAHYLGNRALWVDEANLALNVIGRDIAGLLRPLADDQAAPFGFLALAKIATTALGENEYALRLLPLLAGLASLPVFLALARRCVSPVAVPVALALFALAEPLVYYAAEFKQYSSDVFVSAGLWLAAARALGHPASRAGATGLGAMGALAVWLSHPAVFVLAGVGTALVADALGRHDRASVRRYCAAGVVWIMSFGAAYLLTIRPLADNATLLRSWDVKHGAFMPLPPASVGDLEWFAESFFELFEGFVGVSAAGLAGVAFLAGGAALLRKRREVLLLLLGPLLYGLAASGIQAYPLRGRLLLFMAPAVALLVAEGTAETRRALGGRSRAIVAGLAGLLLLGPVLDAMGVLFRGVEREEIRPVLEHVQRARSSAVGDAAGPVYVYYAAVPAFRFYAERYAFGPRDWVEGVESRGAWEGYRRDLERLRGRTRVWVVFSHVSTRDGVDERALFLDWLDGHGRRLDTVERPGSSAYLYDLSGTP